MFGVGRGDALVVGALFGVFGDDVPGVEKAGEEAEAAEGEVDEGVGAADAGFDPDWMGGGGVSVGLREGG